MVSAVSSAVSAVLAGIPPDAGTRPAGRVRWFFKVPDLSDETVRQINKAKAMPTFTAICRALHDRGRRGTKAEQAAADNGMIGIGIKGLGRNDGLDPVTVRRQIRKLQGLGLVVVATRGITTVADRATGRITANRIGRTPTALVYLTVTEAHMRPAAARAAAKVGGAKRTPSGGADRVQSAPPSTERSKEKQEPRAKAPSAAPQEPGLTAGKAGGHAAAGAGHEGRQADHDGDRQDDPVPEATPAPPAEAGTPEPSRESPRPVGNVLPPERSGRSPSPTPARSSPSGGSGLMAEGAAENSSSADGTGMRGGSWMAEYRALCADVSGSTAADELRRDQAADELRKALDDLPADSRQRGRDLGHAIEDAETKALNVLIEERRRQQIEERRAEAKAVKAAAREAYRRQKSTESAA
jgi:hypothetical protein